MTLKRCARVHCLVALGLLTLWASPAEAWHSTLYPADWQPPSVGSVNFETNKLIQDFSYAGYKAGEQSLPTVAGPLFNVTQPPYNADKTGVTNATTAIQTAINAAQSAGGGVVYLPAGLYSINPQGANSYALQINFSNVILRGAGVGATFLLNTSTNMRSKSIILITGPSAAGFYSSGAASTTISQNLLGPTLEIPVTSTNGFAAGQWVTVRADCTDAWITEHNEPDWIGYGSELQGIAYFRKVVAVSAVSNTITINAPTRYYLKTRDNARVVRLSSGPLLGCGLESFSIGNVQHGGTNWGEDDYTVVGTPAYDVHDSFAIRILRVRDSWMRDVATFQPAGNTTTAHLLSNGILLNECSQVTLTNCYMQHAQYGGGGGNGYMYRLQNCNECLLDNCQSYFTRHGFVLSHMSSSGNVYHECTDKDSGRQTGDTGLQFTAGSNSDHHMHFSHGNLMDTCTGDGSGFEARYRPYGTAPLHDLTAAHSVFWNTRGIGSGPSYVVTTEQSRYGYAIGTRGTRSGVSLSAYGGTKCNPLDHVEGTGLGDTLEPFSLYEDQLNRRLNRPAVAIIVPATNTIYLSSTNQTLLLSAAASNTVPTNVMTTIWTQTGGPGTVTFGNSNALTTTANFSANGTYSLTFAANNGAINSVSLTVLVNSVGAVTNGLLGWWKMDETGGTTAVDSSGNGANAAVHGGTFTTGSLSNALHLTSGTNNASFTSVDSAQTTVAAWVRADSKGSSSFPRILVTPGYYFNFRFDGLANNNALDFATTTTANGATVDGEWLTPSNSINTGAWYHVTASYDKGSTTNVPALYINGVRMIVQTTTPPSVTPPSYAGTTYIGNRLDLTRGWDGLIDDLRIYNRLLSDAEVQSLAAAPPNLAPTVSAGANQTILWPAAANLTGAVADDGIPNPPGVITVTWSKISGPGAITFANSNALTTTAGFSVAGNYQLQLAANDGQVTTVASVMVAALTPPNLFFQLQPGALQLSWPSNNGNWQLQFQTNLSLTNWQNLPGIITNPFVAPIDPAAGSVFYRLLLMTN
jgi:hypothetical protein